MAMVAGGILCIFLSLLCLTILNIHFSSAQIVTTTAGNVSGTTQVGVINGVSYRAFINIPYAMPPNGNLRFKAPVAFRSTSASAQVINTKTTPVFCPQRLGPTAFVDEDCLILNVYTPMNVSLIYPVMVWIHGGAFSLGSSFMYQPEFLIAESVIVVTLNYRLGALGFLSLGDKNSPGNAGLKDQALAMTWVKDEISKFGGDPTRITLFGESAGSACVHHHVLSKYSNGLFHRAIMQSGTISDWSYMESGFVDYAKTLAQTLGCVTNNEVVFSCLQNATVKDIINFQAIPLDIQAEIQTSSISFVPVKETIASGAFHNQTIADLMTTIANPVNAIMGTTKDEGLLLIRQSDVFFNNFFRNLQYFIPQAVRSTLSDSQIKNRTDKLKNNYFPDGVPPSIFNYQNYVDLYTDKLFALRTLEAAEALQRQNASPSVYMYRFEYRGDFNMFANDAYKLGINGVAHGDDLGYLFYKTTAHQTNTSTEALSVLRKMVKMWTTFAASGNPIPSIVSRNSDLSNITWSSISSTNSSYLSITEAPLMVLTNYSKTSTIQVWNDLLKPSSALHLQSTILLTIVSFITTKFLSC